jgi:alkylation response protein AidB-like acyl-CoA dehydrogenase
VNFDLTDDQRLFRDEIVRFAQRELSPGAEERDRNQAFPRDLWLRCGEMGLQGLPVPEEWGGSGADPITTVVVLEALGYGCDDGGLVFALCAHLLACVVPIWKHGSEEQKRRYLPDLCSGVRIAVNGMTEPASGSDAFAISTKAVPDGDGFRLNGMKTFSSNGPIANVAVVYAATDAEKGYSGGTTAFIVDTDTPGFSHGQKFEKMGLRSCPIGELVLEDVFVPRENVLGGVGGGGPIFSQSMEWERVCLVATHVGRMQRLLERSVDYARKRKAFGQSIGKYQAVSHRIADMKIQLEAARLLTYRGASRLDRARDVAMDAAITKTFVSEALVDSALGAVRTLGGYGIMTEYEVERVLRDSVAGTLYSGTNDMMRNIIARWLGL